MWYTSHLKDSEGSTASTQDERTHFHSTTAESEGGAFRHTNTLYAPTSSLSSALLSNAATPGSTLPSSSSKLAPPPVEMCDIFSDKPDLFTADTESPPPMMVIAPFFSVSSAKHSAIS